MRTPTMCYSMLRVPRCSVYSLVNSWWESSESLSKDCKGYNLVKFRSLGSSVSVHDGNSRRWSRRYSTTRSEGRSKNTLSSAPSITHGLSDKIVETTSTKLPINHEDGSKHQQIQCTDVRQLIVDNKDLASLATFIVFDLETTGFSRSEERIIEIALQDLIGGENSTFHSLINPGRAIPNSFIHGITTNMVNRSGVPRMEELIPILLQFVKSRQKPGGYVVLVAHNARCFDVPFLVNEFSRCSTEIPPNWFFLDTLPLSREAMKSGGIKVGARVSLQALREHYKIPLVGSAHRAMSDVHSLSLILQQITYDLKLPVAGLVQKAFTANELTVSSAKKKKDTS